MLIVETIGRTSEFATACPGAGGSCSDAPLHHAVDEGEKPPAEHTEALTAQQLQGVLADVTTKLMVCPVGPNRLFQRISENSDGFELLLSWMASLFYHSSL